MLKKMACLISALALCVSTGAALADCTLEKVSDLGRGRFIYNSNLIRTDAKDGYAVMTVDGKQVTDKTYVNVDSGCGYVIAAQQPGVNTTGAFDAEGRLVVPFEYGDIKFLTPEWALCYKLKEATADNYDYQSFGKDTQYFLIDTVDVYNMKTEKIATMERANFKDAEVVNGMINIENRADGTVTTYDAEFKELGTVDYLFDDDFAPSYPETFKKNGQEGLMDKDGNVIMDPAFYMIYDFSGEYAEVSDGENEGLIDRQGNVVVPAEYENVERSFYLPYDAQQNNTRGYKAAGYFGVQKDGKVGFVKEGGEVTCEPKISKKAVEFNGASATYTDMEGKTHILAADGVDTVLDDYENMFCLDYSSGLLYKVSNKDHKAGVIDWHGNVVMPCEYNGFSMSADGQYLLAEVDWDKSELYAVKHSEGGSAAPAAAPAAAQDENTVQNQLKAGVDAKMSEYAPEAKAEEPKADAGNGNQAVAALLDSAALLIDTDAASAKTVLDSAAALLAADHPAQTMLKSAVTLLEADAAANAASVKALLDAAKLAL